MPPLAADRPDREVACWYPVAAETVRPVEVAR
jgi:hypothetical protein